MITCDGGVEEKEVDDAHQDEEGAGPQFNVSFECDSMTMLTRINERKKNEMMLLTKMK